MQVKVEAHLLRDLERLLQDQLLLLLVQPVEILNHQLQGLLEAQEKLEEVQQEVFQLRGKVHLIILKITHSTLI